MISRMPEIFRCMNEVQVLGRQSEHRSAFSAKSKKKRVLNLTGNAERCSDCLVVRYCMSLLSRDTNTSYAYDLHMI